MVRVLRCFMLLLPLALIVLPSQAQRSQGGNTDIQVFITFDDNRPVREQMRVELENASGIPVSQGFSDDSGRAWFQVSNEGGYILKVSGESVKGVATESFEVFACSGRCSRQVYVRVKPKDVAAQGNTQSTSPAGTPPVTSAAELRVPQNARKAFDQGMTAWQKKDYQQAADKFEKAVADYPEYDTAYNNLGVMYAHLGQNDKAMAAFKRSVELNDKNADADRNLARMLLREKKYAEAEDLLKKSLAVEPSEPATLTMLVMAEAQDGKLDEAVADAKKVHAVPHEGYAVVHYIAGEILEDKHQSADAIAEYNLYLKEAPSGPEAAQAKTALERLSTAAASVPPKAQ